MEQYDHWALRADEDGTVWVEFDRSDKSTNAINLDVLLELEHLIETLWHTHKENPHWEQLVFCSKKVNGFIAGADILDVFAQNDVAKTDALIEKGQELFLKIEHFPLPTVALIHGFCLGGGFELALACDWRIALHSPTLAMGLPEVMLGLQPGWGGSVRLPRLIGVRSAFEMILSGKTLKAHQIKRLKVADYVIPERLLVTTLQSCRHKRPRRWLDWPWYWSFPPMRWLMTFFMRRTLKAQKISPQNYPAPWAIIDGWQRHGHLSKKAFDHEVLSIQKLCRTQTAQHLINVFRLRDRAKKSAPKTDHIKRVHVLGAGVMGGDIAFWAAAQGFQVSLSDPDLSKIHSTMQRAEKWARRRLKKSCERTAFWDRLMPDPTASAMAAADLIIEAVPEKIDLKHAVLQQIEKLARPDAIVATNTSTIPIENLATAMRYPQRLIGIHFFNPVPKMPLVEVISGEKTEKLVHERAMGWITAIKKLPLAVKSTPGFFVNRVLLPYITEGLRLYHQGQQKELVDKSAVAFGMPMGPIELADQVGLDVCAGALESMGGALEEALQEQIHDLIAAQHLGKKTGKGFYQYKKGRALRQKIKDQNGLNLCQDRLLFCLLNEVVQACDQQVVASADDADMACLFGFGFPPFRGGPFVYIAQQGVGHLLQRFEACTRERSQWPQEEAAWQRLAQKMLD